MRKEYESERAVLHLYLELNEETPLDEVQELVRRELLVMSSDYYDIENMLGMQPLRVTLLESGTFDRYYRSKQAQGADLAHLKPPHFNASDVIIEQLVE